MAKVLLAVLAVVVCAASVHAAYDANQLWHAWKAQHGKTYESVEQELERFSIFNSNLKLVEEFNSNPENTFKLAATKFADMTNDEYRASLGFNPRPVDVVSRPPTYLVGEQDPPASFDWRTKGAVTPVKDQGQCGSCWAFSATAAMEGAHFQYSGKLLSLSEQLCVDCVNGGADDCNTGGEMHDCYLQIIAEGGDELESDYPYTATSGNSCRFTKSKAVATEFKGYVNVTSGDESALQVAASQHVVSVGIDASSIWFQLYSSGVYNLPTCKNQWDQLDHGVTVVGYDTDSKGGDYWIVKNSWGTGWGQKGYIWMSRNKNNQCGIATDATYPTY